MIQIKRQNLEQLAERHFVAIENYLNKNTRGNTIAKFNTQIQKYFKEYNLKKIILAKPKELDDLVLLWNSTNCKNKDDFQGFETYYSYLSNNDKFFIKIDNKTISYTATVLVDSLNISVCPYCNRNFIRLVNSKRTDELDHFYPKSKYPFLAISFYNLIPSCKTCNQTFKKAEEISINPYSNIPDFKFKLKICDAQFYHNKEKIKIDFTQVKQVLAKNAEVLKLEAIYNQHKDISLELIQKSQTYNESYIDELFRKYEGTLFRSREDVLRLALGNFVETEDFEKRPLAKLTHDIAQELGLLS
jgi:hypothetical protein